MNRSQYLETIKQHLKTAYLLNDEKTEAMIPVFLNTLHSHVDKLTELAEQGDMEQISRAGHAVKGALLNMGLADLAETAYLIEQQGKIEQECTDDFKALITKLRELISILS